MLSIQSMHVLYVTTQVSFGWSGFCPHPSNLVASQFVTVNCHSVLFNGRQKIKSQLIAICEREFVRIQGNKKRETLTSSAAPHRTAMDLLGQMATSNVTTNNYKDFLYTTYHS